MAAKDRRIEKSGNPLPFSCANRRYQTNVAVGKPHGKCLTLGSVMASPLVDRNGYSLWLEHVEEIASGDRVYWLMWYDIQGVPTIPLSGVFDKSERAEMAKQLMHFVP